MPTPAQLAANIDAYNSDKASYWNKESDGHGFIADENIEGEYGASYFDGVDTDMSDFASMSAEDQATVRSLTSANRKLKGDPC